MASKGATGFSIADLMISLGLDPRNVDKGLLELESRLKSFERSARHVGQGVAESLAQILASGAYTSEGLLKQVNTMVAAGATLSEAIKAVAASVKSDMKSMADSFRQNEAQIDTALNRLGVTDPFRKLRAAGKDVSILSAAHDEGLISDRAYQESLQKLNQLGQSYENYKNGIVEANEVKRQSFLQLSQGMRRFGEDLSFIGWRLTASVTMPLVALGKVAFSAAGDIEKAQASMAKMLGSGEIGDRLIGQIRNLTEKAPIAFDSATEGLRRLIAMRMPVGQLVSIFKTLSDTVAGVGGDAGTFNRITKALGDVQAKGYLAAEEVRQFTNANINAVEIIANKLGISTTEVFKRMKAKSIDAVTAIDALMSGLSQRFGGQLEVMADTIPGIMTRLQTKFRFAMADIGTSLAPAFKDAAQWISQAIDKVSQFADWLGALDPTTRKIIVGMLAMTAALGPLALITGQTVGALGHLGIALSTVATWVGSGSLIAGISTLGTALAAIGSAFAVYKILDGLSNTAHAVSQLGLTTEDSMDAFVDAFVRGENAVKGVNKEVDDLLTRMAKPQNPVAFMQTVMEEGNWWMNVPPMSQINQDFVNALKRRKFSLQPFETIPQVTPFGVTNPMKEGLDRQFKVVVADAEEAAKKIQQAFSQLGLTDLRKELNESISAFNVLKGVLSFEQQHAALTRIVDQLYEARKAGVLLPQEAAAKLSVWEKKLADVAEKISWITLKPLTPPPFKLPEHFPDKSKVPGEFDFETVKEWVKVFPQALPDVLQQLNEQAKAAGVSLKAAGEAGTVAGVDFAMMHDELVDTNKDVLLASKGFDKMASGLSALGQGILNGTGQLQQMKALWKKAGLTDPGELSAAANDIIGYYNEVAASGLYTTRELEKYWLAMIEAQIRAGRKLSPEMEWQYRQIRERTGDEVKLLQRTWKNFGRQMSSILTDMSRALFDVLWPDKKGKEDEMFGFSSRVFGAFEDAYRQLLAMGYTQPRAAIDEIIKKIVEAGDVAEANRIAIRHFGDIGPEIAAALRSGTVSADNLAKAFDKIAEATKNLADQTEKEGSKISQVWREIERAMFRALVEEAGKTIGQFIAKHLRRLWNAIDDTIYKIPGIGKALEAVFGRAGDVAKGLPVPPKVGAPMPTPTPGTIPTGGTPQPTGGGGGAGAGMTSGGWMGWVNMITGGITAVSSVIGNFQAARQENTLNAIEESTRYLKIYTGEQSDSLLATSHSALEALTAIQQNTAGMVKISLTGALNTDQVNYLLTNMVNNSVNGANVMVSTLKQILWEIKSGVQVLAGQIHQLDPSTLEKALGLAFGGGIGRGIGAGIGGVAGSFVGAMFSGFGGIFQGLGALFGGGSGKDADVLNKHTLQTANDIANLRVDEWARWEMWVTKFDEYWRSMAEGLGNIFTRLGEMMNAGVGTMALAAASSGVPVAAAAANVGNAAPTNVYIDGTLLSSPSEQAMRHFNEGTRLLRLQGIAGRRKAR